MKTAEKTNRRDAILAGIYSSSMSMSMTALVIVAALEMFMLVYSVINAPMYGEFLWRYRLFYLLLLTVALAYIILNLYVKKDIHHRFKILNVTNPIFATFFFAWALGITFSDAISIGNVDSMVFMTFSLTVPLSFYLLPSVYAAIVIVADALMLSMVVTISGSIAPLINLSIFCIFQIVLGVSFLRLRTKLVESLLDEQENADRDALTGFANRRVYDKDMKRLSQEPAEGELAYVSIDLNGLKEVNDSFGHGAGDKLIIGASQCIARCFEEKGTLYRIGGDEFVVVLQASKDEIESLLRKYDEEALAWTNNNDLELSSAHGYACHAEFPGEDVIELAKVADQRMYVEKSRYYQESGRDRRRRF